METSDILFERRGAAGLVTLNRPQALNAVTHAMVLALRVQLDKWAGDHAITRVVIQAAGGRAFCAGGDIRHLYDLGQAGRRDEALQFWRDEYPLNAAIKNYRKPYVALIDGIVMGGGVGVSVHGSHRVAGDRYSFAMPEVGIGFFPDVGATWVLPRLAGELGTYCALTGERFDAQEALRIGLVHEVVPLAELEAAGARIVNALLSNGPEAVSQTKLCALRSAWSHLDEATFAGLIKAIPPSGSRTRQRKASRRSARSGRPAGTWRKKTNNERRKPRMLPIEIRDVTLNYDTPGGKVQGVKDVSFTIAPSEFVCIVGPSGCGKSTLLNIIAGFLTPAAGEIRIDGNRTGSPYRVRRGP